MPAGIEHPCSLDADVICSLLELVNLVQPDREFFLVTGDTGIGRHDVLKLLVQKVRVLFPDRLEWTQKRRLLFVDLAFVDTWHCRRALGELGGGHSRPASEDQEIPERIATQTIGAVQPGRTFARGE